MKPTTTTTTQTHDWNTPLPRETAIIERHKGSIRVQPEQSARILSIPFRSRDAANSWRDAFSQFADSELVLIVHPEGTWACIARREPARPLRDYQAELNAKTRAPRGTIPFVLSRPAAPGSRRHRAG